MLEQFFSPLCDPIDHWPTSLRVLRLDPPIAQQDILAGMQSDTGNVQLHSVKALALAKRIPDCDGVPSDTTDAQYLRHVLSLEKTRSKGGHAASDTQCPSVHRDSHDWRTLLRGAGHGVGLEIGGL